MLIIQNNEIQGLIAPITHQELLMQLRHESGAAHWIAPSTPDGTYALADVSDLQQRTLTDIQATPEYQAWLGQHPEALPALTVSLSITGGDGRDVPGIVRGVSGQDSLAVTGDIRDASGALVPLSYAWRVTVVKVRSVSNPVALDSFTLLADVVAGAFTLPVFTHETPGVYMISDDDFDVIPGAMFGLPSDHRVVLADGPKFFKVI